MNAPPSNPRPFVAVWVAACFVGGFLSPLGYIVIGALAAFAPMFSIVMLPPLITAAGWLLYRNLFSSLPRRPSGVLIHAANSVAWTMIALFLFFISGFTLLRPLERLGILGAIYLTSTVIALPIVWIKRARLAHAPAWAHGPVGIFAAALLSITASAALIAYTIRPATLY